MCWITGEYRPECVKEGTFDNAFPYESAELVLAMIMGFMDVPYENTDANDPERRMESLLYNMERMLGAKEGSFAKLKELSLYEKRGEKDE